MWAERRMADAICARNSSLFGAERMRFERKMGVLMEIIYAGLCKSGTG
jgi:hypothetical protein